MWRRSGRKMIGSHHKWRSKTKAKVYSLILYIAEYVSERRELPVMHKLFKRRNNYTQHISTLQNLFALFLFTSFFANLLFAAHFLFSKKGEQLCSRLPFLCSTYLPIRCSHTKNMFVTCING